MTTLEQLFAEHFEFTAKTFPEATAISSLQKLDEEWLELEIALLNNNQIESTDDLIEEYIDCIMCLVDSAGRMGITAEQLKVAFEMKLEKNKARTWVKNENNTYSHVKTTKL